MFEKRLCKIGWTYKVGNLLEKLAISYINFLQEFEFFEAFFQKLFKFKVKKLHFTKKNLA
jgi:hypothetical protein